MFEAPRLSPGALVVLLIRPVRRLTLAGSGYRTTVDAREAAAGFAGLPARLLSGQNALAVRIDARDRRISY